MEIIRVPADRYLPFVARLEEPARDKPRLRQLMRGCPCACNSGGFCGGCGHAGCGGR